VEYQAIEVEITLTTASLLTISDPDWMEIISVYKDGIDQRVGGPYWQDILAPGAYLLRWETAYGKDIIWKTTCRPEG
jgi:hypothetical protein